MPSTSSTKPEAEDADPGRGGALNTTFNLSEQPQRGSRPSEETAF